MDTKTFLLVIAIIGGLLQNQDKIRRWLNPPPPRAPGSDKVVLYSTKWCGYCAKTRKYFAENNIAYQDLDVELNESGKAAYQRFGAPGVPIVEINDDKVIFGYNPDEIEQSLAGN